MDPEQYSTGQGDEEGFWQQRTTTERGLLIGTLVVFVVGGLFFIIGWLITHFNKDTNSRIYTIGHWLEIIGAIPWVIAIIMLGLAILALSTPRTPIFF